MTDFPRVAVIKTGWCEEYQGELAQGAHANISANNESHESYNYKRGPDGAYYAYAPPIGKNEVAPSPRETDNWLVFHVAKKPRSSGIYLVGWYENAEFECCYVDRPEYSETPPSLELDIKNNRYGYTIRAASGFMIPASQRTMHFKGKRTKRSPVFYLRGNNLKDSWREELAETLLDERKRWLDAANGGAVAPVESGGICGDATRRKEVEEAAIEAVVNALGPTYRMEDRQKDSCGFDLLFTHIESGRERHVEVKGTQLPIADFFLSYNEDDKGSVDPDWELALVTNALSQPEVEFMTYDEAEAAFDWKVVCWHATRKAD